MFAFGEVDAILFSRKLQVFNITTPANSTGRSKVATVSLDWNEHIRVSTHRVAKELQTFAATHNRKPLEAVIFLGTSISLFQQLQHQLKQTWPHLLFATLSSIAPEIATASVSNSKSVIRCEQGICAPILSSTPMPNIWGDVQSTGATLTNSFRKAMNHPLLNLVRTIQPLTQNPLLLEKFLDIYSLYTNQSQPITILTDSLSAALGINVSASIPGGYSTSALEGFMAHQLSRKMITHAFKTLLGKTTELESINDNVLLGLANEISPQDFLSSIYDLGVTNIMQLRLGPFHGECSWITTQCECNQGMRSVFITSVEVIPSDSNQNYQCIRSLKWLDFSINGLKSDAFQFTSCQYSYNPTSSIRLGQLSTFTMSDSAYGEKYSLGIQAALARMNQIGGVRGNVLELVVLDDQGDPKVAREKMKSLITDYKVSALLGLSNMTVFSCLDIIEQHRIPVISPFSSDSSLSNQFNPYIINMRPSFDNEIDALMNFFAIRRKFVFFAAFAQDDPVSSFILDTLKKKLDRIHRSFMAIGVLPWNYLSSPILNSFSQRITELGQTPQLIVLLTKSRQTISLMRWANKLWPNCLYVTFLGLDHNIVQAISQVSLNLDSKLYFTHFLQPPLHTASLFVNDYQVAVNNMLRSNIKNSSPLVVSGEYIDLFNVTGRCRYAIRQPDLGTKRGSMIEFHELNKDQIMNNQLNESHLHCLIAPMTLKELTNTSINYISLEGYAVGRLISMALERTNGPITTKEILDTIYNTGVFRLGGMQSASRFGPYGPNCTGSHFCKCNMGARMILLLHNKQNLIFSLPEDKLEFDTCGYRGDFSLPMCTIEHYKPTVGECMPSVEQLVAYRWIDPNPLNHSISIACSGLDLPASMMIPCNHIPVNSNVGIIVRLISGVCGFIVLGSAAFIYKHRRQRMNIMGQHRFILLMLFGGFCSFLSIHLLPGPPSYVSCLLAPNLLRLSGSIVIIAILVRLLRIRKIFDRSHLLIVRITDRQMFATFSRLITVDIVLLSMSMVADNPKPMVVYQNTPIGSVPRLSCVVATSGFRMFNLQAIYQVFILFVCLFYAIRIRHAPSSLHEARWFMLAAYNIIICLIVIAPPIFFVGFSIEIGFLIWVSGTMVIFVNTLLFTVATRMYYIYRDIQRIYHENVTETRFPLNQVVNVQNSPLVHMQHE